MDREELLAAFARDRVDPGALRSETQIELALQFSRLYERHGLIRDAIAAPLWGCCPNGGDCWRNAPDARPTGGPEDGGISLPWIGSSYRPGGVVVIGINFNDANGLTRAYQIAPEDSRELTAGQRRVTYGYPRQEYAGSDFPYRSTRSAALLSDYLDGVPVTDREAPQDVAQWVHRIVRLQAIKCSPRNDKSSKPTNEMWVNCPPMLLEAELHAAQPGAVIGFGADVRWVFGRLPSFEVEGVRSRVQYGSVEVAERTIPVYLIDHPRSNRWAAAHATLADLLRERQQRRL
jgi:hypothetical protein